VRSAIPLLLLAASGAAQSLRIETRPVRAGEPGAATIRLESAGAAKPLTALQWSLVFPARNIVLDAKSIVAGDTAGKAGKSLACSGKKQGDEFYLFRCILAGGVQAIPGGTAATVTFNVAPDAKPGDFPVRLEHAMATDATATAIKIPDASAKLTIEH
jgi:hypothetical protein